jgi:hypothetical protein
MKNQRRACAMATALLSIGVAGKAIGSEVLYDGIGLISGQQTVSDSFSVSGPGTLTVTLQDMAFPTPLANLGLVVSNAQGLLGPESGAGTMTYQVGGPERIYVEALATAGGSLDTGVYGLDVMWKPSVTPVPLPTSLALLASGLLILGWQHRQRRAVAPA